MTKKSLLVISVAVAVTLSGCGVQNCKPGKGKMSHMTRMAKMHWDDSKLGLTAE